MGFERSNAQRNDNASQGQNDSWKAQGFLNLYLPKPDGSKGKLGAIALKDSRPAEKALMAFLNEDPTRVSAVLAKLIIEYRPATPQDTGGFDLG
jgi:hypothetical protein